MLWSALLKLALIASAANFGLGLGLAVTDGDSQRVLASGPAALRPPVRHDFTISEAILQAVEQFPDPVDAYLSLRPEAAKQLAEPRLIHVMGSEEPEWMTVGDKMRLRRKSKKFMDVTEYQDMYSEQVGALAGQASTSTLCLHSMSAAFVTYTGVQSCRR
jgi:bacterial leucyl aminopeptidase